MKVNVNTAGSRRIIAMLVICVMLISLVPTVFAEDGITSSGIVLSEPTVERIFSIVNDVVNDTGYLMTEPVLRYDFIEGRESVKLSELINEDGTFTDFAKQLMTDTGYTDEDMPEDIYEVLDMNLQLIHGLLATVSEEYVADFPTFDSLKSYIMDAAFGENRTPSAEEIIELLYDGYYVVDSDGYLCDIYSDYVLDDEGYSMWLSDFIAPSGAYLEEFEQFGSYRNVYEQLKAEWDAGEIDSVEAFAILTGYTADLNGNLYAVTPVYDYVLDENGKRIYDYEDALNEDLTVGSTGLSAREYAISVISEVYSLMYESESTNSVITDLTSKYQGVDMNDVNEMVESDIDSFIAEFDGEELSDRELALAILEYIGSYDDFGYVVQGVTLGYAKNDSGEIVNIADIMDADGNFLTDEFGAETIDVLMEAYLNDMSTDALLKGDVNDDGKVTISDASDVLKYIAEWENVSVDEAAADMDGDGSVSISDVIMILKYIADWDIYIKY